MRAFETLRCASQWVGSNAVGPCSIMKMVRRDMNLIYTFATWELVGVWQPGFAQVNKPKSNKPKMKAKAAGAR